MKIFLIIFLVLITVLNACNTKRIAQRNKNKVNYTHLLDTINIVPQNSVAPYKASAKKSIDITHMDLNVDFNYAQQTMHGLATLTLRTYFYATDSIVLTAKTMDINKIELLNAGFNTIKNYTYVNDNLTIYLKKQITNKDTIALRIDYTANPEKIKKGTGKAITADKGLYFVNPLSTDATKPREIWTQGETESASCWFPTVEATNEKFTHNLQITVEEKDVTLSNGTLMKSVKQANGMRTDYWEMKQPNAPYLVMLAVGEFEVIKQQWRGKEVSYYLEKEFAPLAQQNFGDTPEMLEYFSNILDVEYPWVNYKQVVARDYVSGAMENTTATLHGEFMNKTKEQSIDAHPFDYYHDVVAHELFHQWFGDLVTCESWSNLPLNESFASYGEYLWIDNKYGTQAADDHLKKQLNEYLYEAQAKQVNMIRYDYTAPDDMFDSHSYQKGSRILHMLRKYVGDAAFFKSLQLYLTQNKFKNAEIANLRMAFEEVTGEDLNWFFNQWFFNAGHPVLSYNYSFDEAKQVLNVNVNQSQQNEGNSLIYQLPTSINVYTAAGVTTHNITINKIDQTFALPCATPPLLMLLDPNHELLSQVNDTLNSIAQLETVYKYATGYAQKRLALVGAGTITNDYKARNLITQLCADDYWGMRIEAIEKINEWTLEQKNEILPQIKNIARLDKVVLVRTSALAVLASATYKNDAEIAEIMTTVLNSDSSVTNKALALKFSLTTEKSIPTETLNGYEQSTDPTTLLVLAQHYADKKVSGKFSFYKNAIPKVSKRELFYMAASYTQYTVAINDLNEYEITANFLVTQTQTKAPDWARVYSYYNIKDLIKANKAQLAISTTTQVKTKHQQLDINLNSLLNSALAIEKSEEIKVNVGNYK